MVRSFVMSIFLFACEIRNLTALHLRGRMYTSIQSLLRKNKGLMMPTNTKISRYLDDLLNIDNNFFDSMVNRIYPLELQLNKANVSDTEASFLCPATKSGGVLCYTLRHFECLSVRPSVCPSVRPSAVHHSCPLHNFVTVGDNFTKLGTHIKHDQTTCRD